MTKANISPLCKEDKDYLRSLRITLEELRLVDIRRQYVWYRARFFGNRVPEVNRVSIVFLPKKETHAGGEEPCYGFYVPLNMEDSTSMVFIAIDGEIERFEAYRTLLHEMAHISVDRKNRNHGHGKMFQDEMKRLARAGAMRLLW
jgi:hypothetical protein